MLKPFRTYHSLTRVIAMVIFVAGALPFIGHACMMAEAHDMPMMKQCCCDEAHSVHEGMDMAERECEDKEESRDHNSTLHGDCCSTDLQATSLDDATRIKTSPEELITIALVVLQAQHVFQPASQKTEGGLQDTGPPLSSSPPLHILHSRFLI